VGDLMYVANSRQIGRARNVSGASPNWISVTGAYTGTIYDFVLDPFDPYNQAWAVGTTGVWKTANLDADPPTWTQILSLQTISETLPHDIWGVCDWDCTGQRVSRILPSPNRPGYFLILITDGNIGGGCDTDEGAWTGRTFDYGATWQWSQLPADQLCGGGGGHLGEHSVVRPGAAMDMADDGSGRIWLGINPGNGQPRVHVSSDWGASWEYIWGITNINFIEPRNLHVPDRNPGVIYMSRGVSLTRSTNGGYAWIDITPPGSQASTKPRGMAGTPFLAGDFFFVSQTSSQGPVFHSSDSGASFPVTFTTPYTAAPNLYAGNASVVATLSATEPKALAALALPCTLGDPACSNAFTQEIAFSDDGGATWSNKTGNWEAEFGTWAGATGSSAAHGNVFIQNPKKVEDTTALLDHMVRSCSLLCSGFTSRNHEGGPIDTLSGNYTYQTVGERVSIPGGSLIFEQTYSADARGLFTRTLGFGWTHNHEVRLVFPTDPGGEDGQVLVQAPGGSHLPFYDQGNGKFTPYLGVTAQMTQITATAGITTYVVTATNQMVYTFNASGLVTQTVSPAGHVVTYTYYPTGPLQSVQSYGRSLAFAYDSQNRLTRVADPINRATQFGYDANSDLSVVTDTRGLVWTYQYSGTTHLLTNVIDPDGKTVERTEFDAQGRATRQYNGNDQLVVQLEYGPSGAITVTDGLNRSSIDRYGRGTWLGGLDAAGQPLTRTYDANFKPTLVADQNGNATQMLWNPGGSNLERIVDAAGFTTPTGRASRGARAWEALRRFPTPSATAWPWPGSPAGTRRARRPSPRASANPREA
jgi:YD repeat-containing protein